MLSKFIKGYGWDGLQDFCLSLFPSVKYHVTPLVISVGVLNAFVEAYFGFPLVVCFAFILLAVIELATGLYSSLVIQNQPYQSHKIGRFGLKLFVYAALFFILFSFEQGFKASKPLLSGFFEWFYTAIFGYTAQEYIVSVAENLAVIKGKPKSYFIEAVKESLKEQVNKLFKKP